jgi:predicted DNA-binding helix-hairpin-helix protein
MELKTASYSELLRVPGIGPVVAKKIVTLRRSTTFRGLSDLRVLGAAVDRAAGFLTIAGRLLRADRWREQLGLWGPEEDAGAYASVYEFSPGTFR